MNKSEYFKAPDFSLVLGGPLFQLLRRVHPILFPLRVQSDDLSKGKL
jgi:hypothetical protein